MIYCFVGFWRCGFTIRNLMYLILPSLRHRTLLYPTLPHIFLTTGTNLELPTLPNITVSYPTLPFLPYPLPMYLTIGPKRHSKSGRNNPRPKQPKLKLPRPNRPGAETTCFTLTPQIKSTSVGSAC